MARRWRAVAVLVVVTRSARTARARCARGCAVKSFPFGPRHVVRTAFFFCRRLAGNPPTYLQWPSPRFFESPLVFLRFFVVFLCFLRVFFFFARQRELFGELIFKGIPYQNGELPLWGGVRTKPRVPSAFSSRVRPISPVARSSSSLRPRLRGRRGKGGDDDKKPTAEAAVASMPGPLRGPARTSSA